MTKWVRQLRLDQVVSWSSAGGTRAVEHLRLIAGELQMADVRAQVALSLWRWPRCAPAETTLRDFFGKVAPRDGR
jgi:hypothetical protein